MGGTLAPPVYGNKMMDMNFNIETLEERLDHRFIDRALLEAALTHPSLMAGTKHKNKNNSSSYERLEFLGDRVLGLVIAQWLYELFPDLPEGDLAKRHASFVNRDALRRVAKKIELGNHLQLVQHNKKTPSRENHAALSDATEAVIGAIYLDGGLTPAARFIKKWWDDVIHTDVTPADPKSALQEWAQGRKLPLPVYRTVERKGLAHAPVFLIEVEVRGSDSVRAEGKSKREAEKAAAEAMLKAIGI